MNVPCSCIVTSARLMSGGWKHVEAKENRKPWEKKVKQHLEAAAAKGGAPVPIGGAAIMSEASMFAPFVAATQAAQAAEKEQQLEKQSNAEKRELARRRAEAKAKQQEAAAAERKRKQEVEERRRRAADPNLRPTLGDQLDGKCAKILEELSALYEDETASRTPGLRLQYVAASLERLVAPVRCDDPADEDVPSTLETILTDERPNVQKVLGAIREHVEYEYLNSTDVAQALIAYYGMKGTRDVAGDRRRGVGFGDQLVLQAVVFYSVVSQSTEAMTALNTVFIAQMISPASKANLSSILDSLVGSAAPDQLWAVADAFSALFSIVGGLPTPMSLSIAPTLMPSVRRFVTALEDSADDEIAQPDRKMQPLTVQGAECMMVAMSTDDGDLEFIADAVQAVAVQFQPIAVLKILLPFIVKRAKKSAVYAQVGARMFIEDSVPIVVALIEGAGGNVDGIEAILRAAASTKGLSPAVMQAVSSALKSAGKFTNEHQALAHKATKARKVHIAKKEGGQKDGWPLYMQVVGVMSILLVAFIGVFTAVSCYYLQIEDLRMAVYDLVHKWTQSERLIHIFDKYWVRGTCRSLLRTVMSLTNLHVEPSA